MNCIGLKIRKKVRKKIPKNKLKSQQKKQVKKVVKERRETKALKKNLSVSLHNHNQKCQNPHHHLNLQNHKKRVEQKSQRSPQLKGNAPIANLN